MNALAMGFPGQSAFGGQNALRGTDAAGGMPVGGGLEVLAQQLGVPVSVLMQLLQQRGQQQGQGGVIPTGYGFNDQGYMTGPGMMGGAG